MSKRQRTDDDGKDEEVRRAIQLIRGVPADRNDTEGVTLTPLERQVVALKQSIPPQVILMVACGYRVKFYGRDSHVISRRSGIMCIPGQPFEYSSVPYTRVDLYIRRLVAMGYHVGFADQESAAVRAVEGVKSGVFQRTVSQLYSRGTLLPNEQISTNGGSAAGGGDEAEEEGDAAAASGAGATHGGQGSDGGASELYLCFLAPPRGKDGVEPLTVVLVSFVTRRREAFTISTALALEDVIQRFDIVEVIVLARSAGASAADYLGLLEERYATVLQHTLPLHMGPTTNGEEDGRCVSVCGHVRSAAGGDDGLDSDIQSYLKPYKLDSVYAAMCTTAHGSGTGNAGDSVAAQVDGSGTGAHEGGMPTGAAEGGAVLALPGSSLRALDVFYSSGRREGSLLALLDHTMTPCGSRKLRSWLAAPLADRAAVEQRQASVAFLLKGGDDGRVEDVLRECSRIGDVEATIGKLHAQRCGVLEFTRLLRMVRTAHAIASDLLFGDAAAHPPEQVRQLLERVASSAVGEFIAANKAAMDSTATSPLELYTGSSRSADDIPAPIQEQMSAKTRALQALDAELDRARELLKLPGLEYRTIGGTPFLIDIPSGKTDRVPKDWTVLTRTKTNVRFHTPGVIEGNVALCAANDRLVAAAAAAWQEEQSRLSADAVAQRVLGGVVDSIAALDALRSLSVASARPGYVVPQLVDVADGTGVRISGGRHPVLDVLLGGRYVSCDVAISPGGAWLLTGPNMGGKSALMRMLGCFVVLAQLGCSVPAAAATLPVFAGLYCRMGSSDSVLEGSSTFLMEMQETSRILQAPRLPQSLVLMDELGRGTSSFDGVAVAAATLEYLVANRVTTIFVTHYSYLCEPYAATKSTRDGDDVSATVECYFMGFREEAVEGGGDEKRLVFTYKPTRGITPSSFGVEIAKMAGLPSSVTSAAKEVSAQEEKIQTQRMALPLIARFISEQAH